MEREREPVDVRVDGHRDPDVDLERVEGVLTSTPEIDFPLPAVGIPDLLRECAAASPDTVYEPYRSP